LKDSTAVAILGVVDGLIGTRVAVTGATGFLGKHVMKALEQAGATPIPITRSTGYDLRIESQAIGALAELRPEIVIHLAGTVGGIIANMNSPATFFRDNMLMGMNVVHACNLAKTRLVVTGTICSYPKDCEVPFREENLWNGFPEPTNAPYGVAKKALLVMCQAYRKQHDFRFAYLMPTNLYGPFDNFQEKSSHVIPALMKRFIEAKEKGIDKVVCYGTGKVTRSFLYARDAAEAIVLATKDLDYDDPINLPGCPEISMADLATAIAKIVDYRGSIEWDASKPDGQPRRAIDGTRIQKLLCWKPLTTLADGLDSTLTWYYSHRHDH
jgi:GDP-L-fucose synthase